MVVPRHTGRKCPARFPASSGTSSKHRRWIGTLAIAATLVHAGCGSRGSATTAPSPTPSAAQSWSDEFDGPAGALPSAAKWTYDLGGGGWGNQELETYTSAPANVHLDGSGHLVIHVDKTDSGYTSARLKTQGLFAAHYGRVEARIKLPSGQGIWPAFWMLGADFPSTPWPQCGEIDIMENVGREPSVNHGSVHGPGYSGGNAVSRTYTLPGGAAFSDDFHVFAIDWAPQSIAFTVDGNVYQTIKPGSLPAGAAWVFDKPFFMILNVAVGGTFPGNPNGTTTFPQEMIVDYVRVTGSSP
jgi:beta-glucanase (GH16 family)